MTRDLENRLLSCKNLPEFMAMYLGLGMKEKQSIFTESVTVKKGTFLYRIRKVAGFNNSNCMDPKEWGPVPKQFAKQGRFNKNGESVLYVGSSPDFLEREVRLKKGEEYYLAQYRCNETFTVGCFLGRYNQANTLIHKITMAVSGPEDLSASENALIDEYYEYAKNKNLFDLSLDMLAPLYINKLLPNLYDVTNKLCKLVLQKYECGIRYSSVFTPIELSGGDTVITFDGLEFGNYILTAKGCEKINLESVEKKTAGDSQPLDIFIQELVNVEKKEGF